LFHLDGRSNLDASSLTKGINQMFVSVPIPMDALVASLSDKELSDLRSIVYNEAKKRLREEIANGTYPAPTSGELELARKDRIGGIQAYRARSSIDQLTVAKEVIEYHLEA
jgi:hypothetical protein